MTRALTLNILLLELDSLLSRGGVYYSIYDHVKKLEDFDKIQETKHYDVMFVVLHFDDSVIDLMGEILEVKCRLSKHDVAQPFKSYAADCFD